MSLKCHYKPVNLVMSNNLPMVWVARIVRLVVLTCHLILQLKGNQIGTFPKEMPGPDSHQTMGIRRQVVSKNSIGTQISLQQLDMVSGESHDVGVPKFRKCMEMLWNAQETLFGDRAVYLMKKHLRVEKIRRWKNFDFCNVTPIHINMDMDIQWGLFRC